MRPARLRARGRLVAIAVALLALAAPAGALADATIGAVGINDVRSDGILLPNAGWNGAADLNLAAQVNVRLYRARLQLNCVDPGHTGAFNFSSPSASCYGLSYDALVGALAQRGMTMLPILINFNGSTPQPPTPGGAGGSPTTSEFAAFAAAAAARYGPAGSYWATCGCTPHPIDAWEIWNEENNGWWWGGGASAGDYASVFAATRAALRGVDPQARAIVGGLAFDPNGQPSFIAPEQMIQALAASNANAFDAVAIHPYTNAAGASPGTLAGDVIALIDRTAAALDAYTGPGPGGVPRQQIWVTEMGWSDQSEDPNAIAQGLQTFFGLLDGGARARDNVGPVLWFDLRNNSVLSARDDQIGLRYTTSSGADAGAKPAWATFSAASESEPALALPAALGDTARYAAPASPSGPAPAHGSPRVAPSPASARLSVGAAFVAVAARAPAATAARRVRLACRRVVRHGHHKRVCTSASGAATKPAKKP